MADVFVVVFVSKRNSLRSVLARACVHVSKGRFKAYSCGNPAKLASEPRELALHAIRAAGIGLRPDRQHDWSEFARPGMPKPQFVITMDESIQDLTPKWTDSLTRPYGHTLTCRAAPRAPMTCSVQPASCCCRFAAN